MLKRFWLWLGRLLGKTLFVLLIVGLGGWAIGTAYYSWKFSGPVSSEEQIRPMKPPIPKASSKMPFVWSSSIVTIPAFYVTLTPRRTVA